MMLCMPRSLIGNCVLDIFEALFGKPIFQSNTKLVRKKMCKYVHSFLICKNSSKKECLMSVDPYFHKKVFWLPHLRIPGIHKYPFFDSVLQSYNNTKNTRGSYCIRENEQAERLLNRDEFELKFCGSSKPELWRFQAEPSWGTSIFELKPSWNFLKS